MPTSPGKTPRQRVIAIIPARGGSVSIPRKNIKHLAGRPLIDWVIQPALHSGIFSEVYVSTDDDEIASIATACGAKVHRRAQETATATASTELALIDFVQAHAAYDILCLIQATSPLIVPDDFRKGLEVMQSTGADSLVTAVRAGRFLWEEKGGVAKAKNYNPLKRPRRQDWDGELIENGAFYMTKKWVLDTEKCRLGGKIALHEMEEHTLTELDSKVDWEIVSHMAETYGYWPANTRPPQPNDVFPSTSLPRTTLPRTTYDLAIAAAAGAALALCCSRAWSLFKS